MIDLYTWSTPNGRKVSIMLEECNLNYNVKPINIVKDEQFDENFLKLNPNNKIPVIIDSDNNVSELNKNKKNHNTDQELIKTNEWLMFQMASIGPMLGQAHHFLKFNKGKATYAEERYQKEALRLYGVLDRRLEFNKYIVGEDYGIADIATWPWISRYEWQNINMSDFTNILRWYKDIASREAVIKGYDIPKIGAEIPIP